MKHVAKKLASIKAQMAALKEELHNFIADKEHFPLEERWKAYCDNQELLVFGPWVDHSYEELMGKYLELVREDFSGNFCWHSDMYVDRYRQVKYKTVVENLEEDNWDYDKEEIKSKEAEELLNEIKEALLEDACGGFTFDW